MDEIHKRGTADIAPASKSSAGPPIRTTERKRSGLYLESTEAEQLGVLPHECIRVRDAMTRPVSVVTPVTEIGEAVRLMKVFDVDALIVCNGSTLVGILCDRDIALANAHPSEAIYRVMTPDPPFCFEDDLLIDAQAMMQVHGLRALPVRDFSGCFSGIVRKSPGKT